MPVVSLVQCLLLVGLYFVLHVLQGEVQLFLPIKIAASLLLGRLLYVLITILPFLILINTTLSLLALLALVIQDLLQRDLGFVLTEAVLLLLPD